VCCIDIMFEGETRLYFTSLKNHFLYFLFFWFSVSRQMLLGRNLRAADNLMQLCIHGGSIKYGDFTQVCVMAHVWMSHGTRMNESRYMYEWVMAHVGMRLGTYMRHGTYMKWKSTHMCESCPTLNKWHHTWVKHAPHTIESRHTYEWVTSHVWMSHATLKNESRHGVGTHERMERG